MNMNIQEKEDPKVSKLKHNRKNGKKYEGELVKVLREKGIYARLGRSNEEFDVTLPELNVNIEIKSTNFESSWCSTFINRKTIDQYHRLRDVPGKNFYAIRWKGQGVKGIRLYPIIPDLEKPPVLYKNEGLTLDEFVFIHCIRIEQEGIENKKDVKICDDMKKGEPMPLKTSNRRTKRK